jgi:hypothetical protein
VKAACTCAGTAPGYPQHETGCGQAEPEFVAPIQPAAGDPELLADGSIVAWEISSRTRISFVSDQIFVTGHFPDPPTERLVTAEQVRRFALLLLLLAERIQS